MSHEQRTEAAVWGRRLTSAARSRRSRKGTALRIAPTPGESARPVHLDSVQRWLQAVIVHPGDVQEAIASPEAEAEFPADRLAELVRPSHSLTSSERVEIYHGMYLLRMVEALEADYPALRHFLGQEEFERLVTDYVQLFPSHSYTLNRLGDHLPSFLQEDGEREHAPFLADLARYELAVTEAFDEQESEVLSPEEVRAIPAEAWPAIRMRPIAAFRLLVLRHPVAAQVEASRKGWTPPTPRRRQTWIAVYRRNYSVSRLELTRPQHDLLAALAAGRRLGEAVAAAALQLRASRRESAIFRWFSTWVAEGMFSSIIVDQTQT
ncbi:MAG: DNA-binding domain-containing protein [Acidobacteriia bacterium]|nr:DNA-binding domain-containing protein [Terriglobia bacterium]